MRIFRKVTDEFWWDVARKCEYATFYHTPIWKEIAERAYPNSYRDETFGAILDSGARVVFPLTSTGRLGGFRRMVSSFDGCYGGLIADGAVQPDEAVELYEHASRWATSSYITDNPLGQMMPDAMKHRFKLLLEEPTFTVNLDTDFETVFSRFSRTQRKDYRRGIKRGVQVRLARSLEDYRDFYHIYRDAVDRWGNGEGYGYTFKRFVDCYELSQIYPENIKLWVMIVNEQIVGGSIVFYWGKHATAWCGTAHRDFLDYEVMPVGDTEMIRDAIERGYAYFDFNTCDQMQGVMEYKQRFGPAASPIGAWLYEYPLITLARALYTRLRSSLTRPPNPNMAIVGGFIGLLQVV